MRMKAYKKHFQAFKTYLYVDQKLDISREAHTDGYTNRLLGYFYNKNFTRTAFNHFIELQLKKGLKKGTVNKYINIAKHYDRFIKTNCLSDYKYFKQENYFVDPLTPEEIKKIARAVVKYKRCHNYLNNLYQVLIYFLALTGCRIGEAINLLKKDVIGNSVVFRNTKNGEQRQVPVPLWLKTKMIALNKESEYVFCSHRGGKLSDSWVGKTLKARAEIANVHKHISPHTLRHSFITELIRQRVPIVYVAELVGHKQIESTHHYTHYIIKDLVEAQNSHPLLKEKQTYEDIIRRVKKQVERLVSMNVCGLSVKQTAKSLAIKIDKLYSN